MNDLDSSLIVDNMSQKIIDVTEDLATNYGVEKINVRRILQILNISNRVFYNRFHNIEEVLDVVYQRITLKIRESIISKFDESKDFFTQVIDIVASTLIMSYDKKMNLSQFIFENDSLSQENYNWWKGEIIKIIEYGKTRGLLRDVNSETLSYAIWCFIRGYNVDALARKLPKDEAVANFKYSFGILLNGMKK